VEQDYKATTVAYSWAESWGLRVQVGPTPNSLVVEDKLVQVGGKGRDGCLRLDEKKLNSKDVEQVISEMWKLTEKLGFGRPNGFRNGTGTVRARVADYEATSMRLTPFERTPNPPAWLIQKQMAIINREARRAAYRYRHILDEISSDEGDMKSIALVYLTIYLNRHRDLEDAHKSGGNLTLFLRQEFARWASVTRRYLRNISFESQGIELSATIGKPVCGAEISSGNSWVEPNYTPPAHAPVQLADAEAVAQEKNRNSRRVEQIEKQEGLLSSMTHHQWVEVMSGVINGTSHPKEAQDEAKRRMKEHCQKCETCRCADEAWTEAAAQEKKRLSFRGKRR
jgi:hypothetical protein